MFRAFLLTSQEGLQGFLIVAVVVAYLRVTDRRDLLPAVWWGIALAFVTTPLMAYVFQNTPRQALLEGVLALLALVLVGAFAREVWRSRLPAPSEEPSILLVGLLACATVLMIVRQSMESAAVYHITGIQLKSLAGLSWALAGTMVALVAAWLWARYLPRAGANRCVRATKIFLMLFLLQMTMYTVHELAEAGVLPFSEPIHTVTEPYGADGKYGQYAAYLLFLIPLIWLALEPVLGVARGIWRKLEPISPEAVESNVQLGAQARPRRRYVLLFSALLLLAAGGFGAWATLRDRMATDSAAEFSEEEKEKLVDRQVVFFRSTELDESYGRLSVVPLENPHTERRVSSLSCVRLHVSGGSGLCLEAQRGLFTKYRGHLFGSDMHSLQTFKLEGPPSRVRISPDGGVGAITVFVAGHSYTGGFSTLTTLVDTESGDTIGEMEQFSVWRDGDRFKEDDFNFWGVSFAADGNHFYATLGSGGKTYLIEAELARRRATVIREDMECSSLSPDGKRIVFKKRLIDDDQTMTFRLHVLDLESLRERPLGEKRSVDDQVEWLDNDHILYALSRDEDVASAIRDIWSAPVDGGPPRIFLEAAESPAVTIFSY